MRIALAPTVWFVHFCAVYILATVLCEQLVPTAVALTAATLGVYAVAGAVDYRRWRGAEEGTAELVRFAHLMLCVVSAVGTLWVVYPVFALPSCA